MSGYQFPGLKMLTRIYKTENRINGGRGVLFFYNNYLVNNNKFDEPIQNLSSVENIGITGIPTSIPDTPTNLYDFSITIAQQPVQQPVSVA